MRRLVRGGGACMRGEFTARGGLDTIDKADIERMFCGEE
jgi:hypothetical protein